MKILFLIKHCVGKSGFNITIPKVRPSLALSIDSWNKIFTWIISSLSKDYIIDFYPLWNIFNVYQVIDYTVGDDGITKINQRDSPVWILQDQQLSVVNICYHTGAHLKYYKLSIKNLNKLWIILLEEQN